ncbi:hypothetical protein [Actinotalea sp. K2]|uniref:hypothetical protein n=1 Tax=Actinotalea sp. K2 TaxID=2939438 RepID=UPI002017E539|nr:hypothetical protein [Actinotalea sp. K2]MCL3859943.1 hypothetical protein [Actinotalea sp. K2]
MQKVAVGALVAPTDDLLPLLGERTVLLADPHSVEDMWTVVGADVTHLVLLGEQRHEALVRRHAALVGDRGVAVSWVCVPHGPATVAVLALQVASCELDAGLLPLFARELERRTWSGAWLPTVARLEQPAPSLGQHLRSWMPSGAGYLATLSGEPGVVRVGRPVRASEPVLARSALVCAGEAIPAPALQDALELAGAHEHIELPGLSLDARGRFGTARAVELLALPAGDVIPYPRVETLDRCAVCGAVVPQEFCQYCHVRPVHASLELQGDPK